VGQHCVGLADGIRQIADTDICSRRGSVWRASLQQCNYLSIFGCRRSYYVFVDVTRVAPVTRDSQI